MAEQADRYRIARIVAVVAGLLGALLAIATPFLPVKQTTAQLNWPQNGVLNSVTAPLISYVATDLDIDIPCSAAAGLTGNGRTVLLSTVPKQAPKAVDRGLLIERVNNNLAVVVRNTPVLVAPLTSVLGPDCRQLTFSAHADQVNAEFVGLTQAQGTDATPDRPGDPLKGHRGGYDFRPQIIGVFTDLSGPAPPGAGPNEASSGPRTRKSGDTPRSATASRPGSRASPTWRAWKSTRRTSASRRSRAKAAACSRRSARCCASRTSRSAKCSSNAAGSTSPPCSRAAKGPRASRRRHPAGSRGHVLRHVTPAPASL